MSLSPGSSAALTILSTVYEKTVGRIATRIGADEHIRDAFWRLRFRMKGNTSRLAVAGHTARFHVETRAERERFVSLGEEGTILADLLQELNQTDVFYDVGANVGLYSCFVASRLPSDQIVGFEPHPENADRLEENLRLNGSAAAVRREALSNETGSATLAVGSDQPGSGTHSLRENASSDTIQIDTVRGEDLVEEKSIPAPTVLKIDVEGAEYEVLRGLKSTLRDADCRVYVEIHRRHAPDGDKRIEAFLRDLGYAVMTLADRESEYFIKAVPES